MCCTCEQKHVNKVWCSIKLQSKLNLLISGSQLTGNNSVSKCVVDRFNTNAIIQCSLRGYLVFPHFFLSCTNYSYSYYDEHS